MAPRAESKKVVRIEFKVAGGGGVTTGSGKNIKTALQAIFNNPTIQKLTQLNVTLNPASVEKLQKDLEAQLKKLPPLEVGVTAKITGVDTKGAAIAVPATVVTGASVASTVVNDNITSAASSSKQSSAQRAMSELQGLATQIANIKQQLAAGGLSNTVITELNAQLDALNPKMVAAQDEVRRLAQLKIDNIKIQTQTMSVADKQRDNQLTAKQNSLLAEQRSLQESIFNIRRSKDKPADAGNQLAQYRARLSEIKTELRSVGKELDAIKAKYADSTVGLSDLEVTRRQILSVTNSMNRYKTQIDKADTYIRKYGDSPTEELSEKELKRLNWAKGFNADNAVAQMQILAESLKILQARFAEQESGTNKATASLAAETQQTRDVVTAKEQEASARKEAEAATISEAEATKRLNEALAESKASYGERVQGLVNSGDLAALREEADMLLVARDKKGREGNLTEEEYAGYTKLITAIREYVAAVEQGAEATNKTVTAKESAAAAMAQDTQATRENTAAKQESGAANTTVAQQTFSESEAHKENAGAINEETEAQNRNTESKNNQRSSGQSYEVMLAQVTRQHEHYAEVLGLGTEKSEELGARWDALNTKLVNQDGDLRQLREEYSILNSETGAYAEQVRRAATTQTQLSGLMVKGRMYYDQYASSIKKVPELSANWDKFFQGVQSGSYSVTQARQELNGLIISSKNAGAEILRLGQRLKQSFMHRIGFTFSAMVFSTIIGSFRKIYSNVKDIDKAMTNLRIITQQTEAAYVQFGDTAAQTAKEIGRSITDVISSAETWARLGYSLSESAGLARATGIFANVADVSESEATTSLTSVLKAYNYNAEDAMRIVDILTQVGQKYAISASELGTALEKGGAALATAGNTLEESVALMAAGNAAVQNAETVGTALKTTTLRVAGSKAELEEMGEDVDDLASSTSKMRKEILALSGVDIMADKDTYKSTYQILKEIASVWDGLKNDVQMTLLEDLAGKKNASVIASVINNLKDLEGAYKDASNAAGTAERAQAIYMGSIEGKQRQLTAQFQEFSSAVLDSAVVKYIYDVGNAVVWLLTQLAKVGAILPGVIAAVGTLRSLKKAAQFDMRATNMADSMLMSFGRLDLVQGNGFLMGNISGLHQYSAALAELSPRMQKRVMDELQLTEAERAAVMADIERTNTMRGVTAAHHAVSVATAQRIMAENGLDVELLNSVLAEKGLTDASTKLTAARLNEIRITLLDKAVQAGLTSDLGKQYSAMAAQIGVLAKNLGGATGRIKMFFKALNTPTGWITGILTLISLFSTLAQKFGWFESAAERQMEAVKAITKAAKESFDEYKNAQDSLDQLLAKRKELAALGDKATLQEKANLDVVNSQVEAAQRLLEIKRATDDADFAEERSEYTGAAGLKGAATAMGVYQAFGGFDTSIVNIGGKNFEMGKERTAAKQKYFDIDLINTVLAEYSMGTERKAYYTDAELQELYQVFENAYKKAHGKTKTDLSLALRAVADAGVLYDDIIESPKSYFNGATQEQILKGLEYYEDALNSIATRGLSYVAGATDTATIQNNEYIKSVYLAVDALQVMFGDTSAYQRTLDHLIQFEILSQDAVKQIAQGEENGSYETAKMIALLERYGISVKDASDLQSVFAAYLQKSAGAANALAGGIGRFTGTASEIKALKDDINALAAGEQEMYKSGYLSYDTYQKLASLHLDDYIEKTTHGYKLATDAIKTYVKAQRALIESEIKIAEATLETTKTRSEAVRAMAPLLRAELAHAKHTGDTALAAEINAILGASTDLRAAYAEVNKLKEELADFDRITAALERDANSSSSADAYLANWQKTYDTNKHMVEMGTLSQKEFMEWIRKDISATGTLGKYREKYLDKVRSLEEEIRKYDLEQLDNQKDAFESLVDYRIKMLEEETKKQKEELDKRKDALEDFYDKQIEMLEDQFDEEDYLEEQAEKRKELADMRREMEMLQRDDSAWAKKRLAELQEEYDEAEKDYQKWERDHARDVVKKTLEDEKEAATKALEEQKEALEKETEDEAAIRKQAIDDILSGNKSIMQAMEEFSIKQGTWLEDNIVAKWELAYKAVQKYGKGAAAIAALDKMFGADRLDNETYRVLREILGGEYQQHAAGTPNAHGGWAVTQEKGPEAILRRAGGLFTLLNPGDKVLNADATNFLYAFANNPGAILASSMSSLLSRNSLTPAYAGMSGNSTINIDTGDVIIQGNADEKTVSEFRREKRKLVNEILQEFKKLR